MASRILSRVAATALVLAAGGLVSANAAATGAPAVTVATDVVYGIGGPDTPLPVAITTSADAASIVVTAGGLIADAVCTGPVLLAVDLGELVITPDPGPAIPADSELDCEITLGLSVGAPPSIDLVVSERDEFNADLGTTSRTLTLDGIDVVTSLGAVVLTGGTHVPAEPRSPGDELSRTITFELPAPRSFEVVQPDGTTIDGCPAATADIAACALSRTLSLADLETGTAPFASTLVVDGWPVAVAPADVAVPSERRLSIEALGSPSVARAGEMVTVVATIENLGSLDLTGLALGGAGFADESVVCGTDDLATLTLAARAVVECRVSRRVTAADVDAVTPLTVRATAPFGDDSDYVDDDTTSPSDVDAITFDAPFSVLPAEASGALSTDGDIAFIDDAGTDDLLLTMTVRSTGALAAAVAELPLAPHPGVALVGCDEVAGTVCRIAIGDLAAEVPFERQLTVRIDAASVGPDGLLGQPITGTVVAEGGVTFALTPTTVSTAGVVVDVPTTEPDVTGDEMTFDLTVTGLRAVATTVELASNDERPFTVDACRNHSGAPVTAVAAGDRISIGSVAAGDVVTCTLRRTVIDTDRLSGATPVALAVHLSADGTDAERTVETTLPTRSVRLGTITAATTPADGYSTDGSAGRPDVARVSFDLVVRGGPATAAPPSFAGDDDYLCAAAAFDGGTRFTCEGTHAVTDDDLRTGSYVWDVTATVSGFATADGSVELPMPFSALELTATELSNPASPAGYRPGDEIRLLLQIRNAGTMSIELDRLSLGSGVVVLRYDAVETTARFASRLTQAADPGCLTQDVLTPGETLDCGLVVAAPSTGGTLSFELRAAGDLVASFSIAVPIDPSPAAPAAPAAPASPTDELPPTGSNGTNSLVSAGLGLVVLGASLAIVGRRRRATGIG